MVYKNEPSSDGILSSAYPGRLAASVRFILFLRRMKLCSRHVSVKKPVCNFRTWKSIPAYRAWKLKKRTDPGRRQGNPILFLLKRRMGKKRGQLLAMLLLATVLSLVGGCGLENLEVGPVRTKRESVEAGAAEVVRAEIKLGNGDLRIGGGAGTLMDAEFTYNVEDWQPDVAYTVGGNQGRLLVEQPSVENKFPFDLGNIRYEWDLLFTDNMPIEMIITLGAGEGNLKLDSLELDRLDFAGGAGRVVIDLSGSTVRDLAVKMGAGDVDLDLSGRWQNDLTAVIQGGIGSTSLRLPIDVGVRVEVRKGLGKLKTNGWNKNGDVYTNLAYGQSGVTLDITIEGGIGSIDLQLAE